MSETAIDTCNIVFADRYIKANFNIDLIID